MNLLSPTSLRPRVPGDGRTKGRSQARHQPTLIHPVTRLCERAKPVNPAFRAIIGSSSASTLDFISYQRAPWRNRWTGRMPCEEHHIVSILQSRSAPHSAFVRTHRSDLHRTSTHRFRRHADPCRSRKISRLGTSNHACISSPTADQIIVGTRHCYHCMNTGGSSPSSPKSPLTRFCRPLFR